MFYRSIAEFEAKAVPTAPERALIAACRAGEPCFLGDGTLPDAPHHDGPDPTRTIRAALLRLLIVGGTADCGLHPSGVWVIGAFVPDRLDLSFETGKGACRLQNCRFQHAPQLTHTHLPQLGLNGSHLPGLFAQGCVIAGSMFLHNLTATGTVDVAGAKIGGQLACAGATLDGAKGQALSAQSVEITADMVLTDLTAKGTVDVADAKIGGHLDCAGATLDGVEGKALNAERVVTRESMFLTDLTATGTVDVNGAKIGGQLAFVAAKLDGAGGNALNAQSVETGEGMFLTDVTATGAVTVNGAKIGGQLDCTRAKLNGAGGKALKAQSLETGADLLLTDFAAKGTVDVIGAKIKGALDCEGAKFEGTEGDALIAQRLLVVGVLIFRKLNSVTGQVDLSSAHVGDLADDISAWPQKMGDLVLVGFTYDRIVSASPSTIAARRDWLRLGSKADTQFNPQPYTQFAKVLRAMGNAPEARKVLYERDFLLANNTFCNIRRKPEGNNYLPLENPLIELRSVIHLLADGLSRWVIGYGHKPWRSLIALAFLFLTATTLAHSTWTEGSFAPNSDVILTSPAWLAVERTDCIPVAAPNCDPNPALTWSNDPDGGLDWDSFNRYGYAADLVIPILDLGQTDAWAPSKDRGPFGKTLWWGRWVLAALGWLVTALGVAAITGIMQRNSPEG